MENKYQVPRGMQDHYGDDINLWHQMEQIVKEQCAKYGYKEIRTPVLEHTEVFAAKNDSSDMVNKEMYSFKDNGERDLTLRPEGTKGVIRSYVEHKMFGNADFPVKLFYIESMFRYDRPQKGRYRQFHQFGVEAIGTASPALDVENIDLGYSVCRRLGIDNVVVLVNSLGDKESRDNYRQALKEYFEPFLPELCPDCQRRFIQNPLRILDCKFDADHPCMANAPKCRDYLTEASKEYFRKVIEGLEALNIPYRIDDRLVRGLDYYTNTVFEAVPVDDNGQQSTVFGGGQYEGLVESFGGPAQAGVGFGMGLERMIELASSQNKLVAQASSIDCYVIALGDLGQYTNKIVADLRREGYKVDTDYNGRSLKAQFKSADRLAAKTIIIAGEDEKNKGIVQLKNCDTKEQKEVKVENIIEEMRGILHE